jgi:hypothetical protein
VRGQYACALRRCGADAAPSHIDSRLGFDRQSGGFPLVPTARQCARPLPSGPLELLRHTGARRFVGSSTKHDDPTLPRHAELADPPQRFAG